jgi:hypothetical protein
MASSSTNDETIPPRTLLMLPGEIRDLIWFEYLNLCNDIDDPPRFWWFLSHYRTVADTNSQVSKELWWVFYNRLLPTQSFLFQSASEIQDYMEFLPKDGWHQIRGALWISGACDHAAWWQPCVCSNSIIRSIVLELATAENPDICGLRCLFTKCDMTNCWVNPSHRSNGGWEYVTKTGLELFLWHSGHTECNHWVNVSSESYAYDLLPDRFGVLGNFGSSLSFLDILHNFPDGQAGRNHSLSDETLDEHSWIT